MEDDEYAVTDGVEYAPSDTGFEYEDRLENDEDVIENVADHHAGDDGRFDVEEMTDDRFRATADEYAATPMTTGTFETFRPHMKKTHERS